MFRSGLSLRTAYGVIKTAPDKCVHLRVLIVHQAEYFSAATVESRIAPGRVSLPHVITSLEFSLYLFVTAKLFLSKKNHGTDLGGGVIS